IRQEDEDQRPATLWIEPPTNEEAWEVVDIRPVSEGESRFVYLPPDPFDLAFAAFAESSAGQHIPAISQPSTQDTSESENIEVSLVPDPVPTTLLEWSSVILNTPNATLKVERTRHVVELFRTGKLKSIGRHKGAPIPPDIPPREEGMTVVD